MSTLRTLGFEPGSEASDRGFCANWAGIEHFQHFFAVVELEASQLGQSQRANIRTCRSGSVPDVEFRFLL